jgi:CRISPR/Cas system Type II protein with McrA/HNH and RuvC-like nuclease domain
MNGQSTVNAKDREPNKNPTINDQELERLKALLFRQEQEQLRFLLEHLENSNLHAKDIAKDLPTAIILHSNYNNKLKTALTPLIEKPSPTPMEQIVKNSKSRYKSLKTKEGRSTTKRKPTNRTMGRKREDF